MYYVYIVRCTDGSLYTGITTDLERRMSEHQQGIGARGAKYTASHPVCALCAAWSAQTRSDASKLEYRIKALTKQKKECLIAHPADLAEYVSLEAVYTVVDNPSTPCISCKNMVQ